MRLLVTAFSLSPGLGSEPGVGWHSVCALAEEHDVHVLVEKNWEPKVNAVFKAEEHSRIHLHFVGLPLLTPLVEGPFNNGLCWLIYYYLWQIAAWWRGRQLHRQFDFEGVQHLTFVKYNVPSGLALLSPPFVFGPVGGGEWAPGSFYREFGWKTRIEEAARVGLQKLALLDPMLRLCVKRSSLALGTTAQTAEQLLALGASSVRVQTAVALSKNEIAQIEAACAKRKEPDAGRTLLYVGRLIAWKGVHLGLRALAQANDKRLRYRIIGEGPLRAWLEKEARRLGVADRVEFAGALPRDKVLEAYATADGFLYPSLHDSGGNAVIEAMCASLPILCLNYGGPDLIVTDECGWKVRTTSPDEAVQGLTSALNEFAGSETTRIERGKAARERCLNEFTWEKRGEQLREIWKQP
jgi:glycosyltransferase involved in cell wall biosynthesis